MKTACPCLAVLAALALAFTPNAAPTQASDSDYPIPESGLLVRNQSSPYVHTAIGAVLDANGGKIPATGLELTKALGRLGEFLQLPVTFSAVDQHSGLKHPRVIMTMRPSTHPAEVPQFVQTGMSRMPAGGWGGGGFSPTGFTKMVPGKPVPLGSMASNLPYLEGRLFLAANTEFGAKGLSVKTVEFISWNSKRLKFDFGVIEGMGTDSPELKILDGRRCFSCHKNQAPIMGMAPWSNTMHSEIVRKTAESMLKMPLVPGEKVARPLTNEQLDGMTVFNSHAVEVDGAVREAAGMMHDRNRVQLLARTAEGRKALVLLLAAVASNDKIENDTNIRTELNQLDLVKFLHESFAADKAAQVSTLADFNPATFAIKTTPAQPANGGLVNQVSRYDAARAAGDHGLPSIHQPSNPKAFTRPTLKAPQHVWDVVTPVRVARAIGLSNEDRLFLTCSLAKAIDPNAKPAQTRFAIAKRAIETSAFADVLETGTLPDRDDFKDRFVAALLEVSSTGLAFNIARESYTSTPVRDPKAKADRDVVALPSHACLACHDVRGAGKAGAFSPIPMLAFDPLDAAGREAWLKTADRKVRADVLSRLAKRLATDKDMPPEDSVEAEMYLVKDPAALRAATAWIEAELKKAR